MVKASWSKELKVMLLAFLLLFLLFAAIQTARKLIGGSWDSEAIILAFVTANFVMSAGLMLELGKTKAEFHKSMAKMGTDIRKNINKVELKIAKIDGKVAKIDDISRRISRIEAKLS